MLISRRGFCGQVGAAGAAWLTSPFAGSIGAIARAADTAPNELRVIAYNILKCTGWPADRNLARRAVERKQIPRRIALELALYDPHVVTFSESPSEELTREIAELLGMNHVRFPSGEDWPGTLLSKFEVVESQNAPYAAGAKCAAIGLVGRKRFELREPQWFGNDCTERLCQVAKKANVQPRRLFVEESSRGIDLSLGGWQDPQVHCKALVACVRRSSSRTSEASLAPVVPLRNSAERRRNSLSSSVAAAESDCEGVATGKLSSSAAAT